VLSDPTALRPGSIHVGTTTRIDVLFGSLANSRGRDAVAVLMDGTGADGLDGLREVKARLGLSIAHDGLGDRRVDADYLLPPAEMPHVIQEYARILHDERNEAALLSSVPYVTALLSRRWSHPLTHLDQHVVVRALRRRMGVLALRDADDYLDRLRDDSCEARTLAHEALTRPHALFDEAASLFTLEREVVAPLVSGARERGAIRAWVPACGTGEDAYLLAMLLSEAAEDSCRFVIFATEASVRLPTLRRGEISAATHAALSPERRARFFEPMGRQLRLGPRLRSKLVVRAHDVLRDPPLAEIDVVLCRNLLADLEIRARYAALERLRHALSDRGLLVIGARDTLGLAGRQFARLDAPSGEAKMQILRKIAPPPVSAYPLSNDGGRSLVGRDRLE
jgi:two-component system CheB/CheR fusion protein